LRMPQIACSVTISKNAHAPQSEDTSILVASEGSFGRDMAGSGDTDKYSEKEAQQRFEAALKGALKTPATPLKDKPKVKKASKKTGGKRKSA
jgi:hypothetical protein